MIASMNVIVVVDEPVWRKGAVGNLSRVRDTINRCPETGPVINEVVWCVCAMWENGPQYNQST